MCKCNHDYDPNLIKNQEPSTGLAPDEWLIIIMGLPGLLFVLAMAGSLFYEWVSKLFN